MDSTAHIPAELLRLATEAARAAVCTTLDIQERRNSLRLDAQLVDTLRLTVLNAIDADLRRHAHWLNKTLCTATGVPPELWVLTWDELSIRDRVSVSHVCQDWRRLAVGTPQLWTRINFRSDCFSDYGDDTCRLDHDPHPDDKAWGGSAWTTTKGLDVFLDRGASRNLDLRIQFFSSHCAESIAEDFVKILSSHTGRIAHLEFQAETRMVSLIDFLGNLGGVFPHMRTLVGSDDFEDDDESESFRDDGTDFIAPRLESLQLIGAASLWPRHIIKSLACPHLLQISSEPTCSADLHEILSNFPALQVVHLDMHSFIVGTADRRGDAKLKSLAVQAQTIQLSNFLSPKWDYRIAAMSEVLDWALQPARRSVTIENGDTRRRVMKNEQEALSLFLQSLPGAFPDTSTGISATVNYDAHVIVSVTAGDRVRNITLNGTTQFDLTRVQNIRLTALILHLTKDGMGRSDLSRLSRRSAAGTPVQVLFPALTYFTLNKYIATGKLDKTRDIIWSAILPAVCKIKVKINIQESAGRRSQVKRATFSKTAAFAVWYQTNGLSPA